MKNAIIIMAVGAAIGIASCKQHTIDNKAAVKQDSVVKTDSTHLIGVWLDEEIKTEKGEQVAYELVSQGKKTFIQVITFTEKKLNIDDNPAIAPGASLLKTSGNKFVSLERPNEIYMVDKSGELFIYDETGLVAKCKRLL
ncbi:hypothetical protein [Mucilaginibacter polytrichastri]|nr:hypothetical protein [Mucilaginibacter polytrichastri]